MRKFYTTAEATIDKFLFVSYSHDDKEIVQDWVDHLIEQGVRVWWDKAFMGGDDWESIAKELLSHENCSGILFFCGQSAIESPNVAKEWRVAAKTKESRSDNSFYPQIIMTNDDPAFDYHYLTNYVKRTEELFSDDDYDDFRSLFGKKDHLYYMASKQADKEALVQNIKARAPQAVDVREIIRDKLADLSNSNKEVIFKLGTYNGKPISWQKMSDQDDKSTLLCTDVLTHGMGGQALTDWLEQFVKQAFSASEQSEIQGKIRLLNLDEAEKLQQELLASGTIWWLNNAQGHLQSVIREDGTIYKHGYHNKLCQKGVRPVITMDSVTLFSILNN